METLSSVSAIPHQDVAPYQLSLWPTDEEIGFLRGLPFYLTGFFSLDGQVRPPYYIYQTIVFG